jgi:hypothetical protein
MEMLNFNVSIFSSYLIIRLARLYPNDSKCSSTLINELMKIVLKNVLLPFSI